MYHYQEASSSTPYVAEESQTCKERSKTYLQTWVAFWKPVEAERSTCNLPLLLGKISSTGVMVPGNDDASQHHAAGEPYACNER